MKSEFEQRRAPRKRASSPMPVIDVMSEGVVGQLGNLSATGLMLLVGHAPRSGVVQQVVFTFPMPNIVNTGSRSASRSSGTNRPHRRDSTGPDTVSSRRVKTTCVPSTSGSDHPRTERKPLPCFTTPHMEDHHRFS